MRRRINQSWSSCISRELTKSQVPRIKVNFNLDAQVKEPQFVMLNIVDREELHSGIVYGGAAVTEREITLRVDDL